MLPLVHSLPSFNLRLICHCWKDFSAPKWLNIYLWSSEHLVSLLARESYIPVAYTLYTPNIVTPILSTYVDHSEALEVIILSYITSNASHSPHTPSPHPGLSSLGPKLNQVCSKWEKVYKHYLQTTLKNVPYTLKFSSSFYHYWVKDPQKLSHLSTNFELFTLPTRTVKTLTCQHFTYLPDSIVMI